MNTELAQMTAGFRDATHGAQRTFRVLLDAMSRPGRVIALPDEAINGIEPPVSADSARRMSVGVAAVMLTLLDAETSVRIVGSMAGAAASAYLRFHTGVGAAGLDEPATFTVAHASDAHAALWTQLDAGTDEAPQDGVTLVLQVDELGPRGDTGLHLRGPGIEAMQALSVSGTSSDFWSWRIRQQALLPRGVDIVLVCGTRIAAIPRTTRIELEH
jgi:alpha-D-ribose 1-methylphosphonate 5-triphosphate synthase subunit PhnH